jgi:hypothetical protein
MLGGEPHAQGYGSVQPESQAKNVLTVGATRTSTLANEDWLTNEVSVGAHDKRKTVKDAICNDGCGLANRPEIHTFPSC